MSQVRDVIDGIRHRLPDRINLYPAINRAVRLVAKRLFYHKSAMIQGSLAVDVDAGDSTGVLPDDYWGLMSTPFILGRLDWLRPVPDLATKLSYTHSGTPLYYEVQGLVTLKLWPGTSSDIVVAGDYFQRPAGISKPGDTIPYNEMFDDAIAEALLHVYGRSNPTQQQEGESPVNDIGSMAAFIYKSVDEIVPYLERRAPTRFEDDLGLDALANTEDMF
jgi:hypothetical protein